jgi:hypothetical protein
MSPIFRVASEVFPTNTLASSATTAKLRPYSLARAASIAAVNASKLVWLDMPSITSVMLCICCCILLYGFVSFTYEEKYNNKANN